MGGSFDAGVVPLLFPMTTEPQPTPITDGLQFDRAVEPLPPPPEPAPQRTCTQCQAPIEGEYYHVNGATACPPCAEAARVTDPPFTRRATIRGLLFGLGAAIAGGIVYYLSIALTGFEIGLVAILVGYMVGWAIKKGAYGRGARRLQVSAVVLTYFAIGLGYVPLMLRSSPAHAGHLSSSAVHEQPGSPKSPDARGTSLSMTITPSSGPGATPSTSATSTPTSTSPAATHSSPDHGSATGSRSADALGILGAIGILLAVTFTLPVVATVSEMPAGLLTAAIVIFGLLQAWRLTAAARPVTVAGPFTPNTRGRSFASANASTNASTDASVDVSAEPVV